LQCEKCLILPRILAQPPVPQPDFPITGQSDSLKKPCKKLRPAIPGLVTESTQAPMSRHWKAFKENRNGIA